MKKGITSRNDGALLEQQNTISSYDTIFVAACTSLYILNVKIVHSTKIHAEWLYGVPHLCTHERTNTILASVIGDSIRKHEVKKVNVIVQL